MDKKLQFEGFNPDNFTGFELFEGEKICFIMRKHWFIHLSAFLKWLFWGVAVVVIVASFATFLGIKWGEQSSYLLLAVLLIYFSGITILFFVSWLNQVLDIIVVTNDRVVDISQVNFFHRDIIETRLENVQDATGTVKGFLNTLFECLKN